MKTTVTPAQVTTVEDRIAGNMTFAQILFLIIPLMTATALYCLISPKLQLSTFKIGLIVLQFLIFSPLAIRIKGKTAADWLVIILKFRLRPRIYLFTKTDVTNREVILEKTKEKQIKKEATKVIEETADEVSFTDQLKIEELLKHPGLSIRMSKKGGIDVALKTEK